MKHNRWRQGYTLIELMMVVAIISLLSSVAMPRIDILIQKAKQSQAKGNLGSIRSALSIYYADMEGRYPFPNVADLTPDLSMSSILSPMYLSGIPVPQLVDKIGSFNGFSVSFDQMAREQMSAGSEVFIRVGLPSDTTAIYNPFIFDNTDGYFYYANNNFDAPGAQRFYEW